MKFVRNGLCRSVEVTPDMTEALGMPRYSAGYLYAARKYGYLIRVCLFI